MAAKEIEEKTQEIAAPASDPWKEYMTVTLPRAMGGSQKSMYWKLNGHSMIIPLGKPTKVPKPIYERVQIYLDAIAAEEALQDELSNV